MRNVIDWIETRTGLASGIQHFLYEDIPASSGWHQVLGSVALFSFLVQATTGILLAFNYAPTPGEAYSSLKYIVTEITAGRLVRGLHHWGASMMIVIVGLHMAQVFVYGAYKKPREATWMVGVVLLLITLGFGLTGYLLPWDNRAYWGTVVTLHIMAQAPIAGPYLTQFLGGSNGIGVVTFARFYAMHVLLLPPLTMLLILVHVFLVRKHGVTPAAGDEAPKRKFFPEQVFKDTVAVFVVFMVLFLMAVAVRVPLEKVADPTDTSYIPRPEWYFLFLFQTLKFFEGPLEIFGSVVLPGLAVATLFLIPFIDRKPVVALGKRTFAISVLVLAALGWTSLTTAAIVTTPKMEQVDMSVETSVPAWAALTPKELEGAALFASQNCKACHPGSGKKGIGPDLTRMPAEHRIAAWLIPHFKNPTQMVPGSTMPPVTLSGPQLDALSAFVLKLAPQNEDELRAAPAFALQGATVYQTSHCDSCHQVNGAGMKVGPPLNGVAQHRDRTWLEQHFRDPQTTSKGTIMPAYQFSNSDMDAICQYLLALPPS
jgi:ubiquinol-cytochrome c reductase cytochrome b subunit